MAIIVPRVVPGAAIDYSKAVTATTKKVGEVMSKQEEQHAVKLGLARDKRILLAEKKH